MPEAQSTRSDGGLSFRKVRVPLLVIGLVAAIWSACFCFPHMWEELGMTPGMAAGNQVFLDLDGILVAGEAVQLGINPFLPNPLDAFNRPHVNSAWWLVTGSFGWTRKDSWWLGPVLDGLTLVAAVLLAWPVGKRQSAVLVAALISPAMLLAVNRCNNDLVVFILMSGALFLLRRPQAGPRVAGIALFALAAVLKIFPLAGAIVLLDARTRRECFSWIAVYLVMAVVAWPGLQPALLASAKYRPNPTWLYAFGAPVIFRDFSLPPALVWLPLGAVVAGAVAFAYAELKRSPATAPGGGPEREYAIGAVMAVGCFALGSSYIYKLVFALWLLPWLWRSTSPGPGDRWRKATLGLLLAVLWLEGGGTMILNLFFAPNPGPGAIQIEAINIALNQVLAWALVLCLMRGLLIYGGRQAARLWRMWVPALTAAA